MQSAWNNTAQPLAPEENILSLFDKTASEFPEKKAVTDAEKSLSYRELQEEAKRLAATLARHGAGPGNFVGIMSGRNCDMVAAMLAVLRSGAAYVPLDPSFPEARIRHMIAHAEISTVLTQKAYSEDLKQLANEKEITPIFIDMVHGAAESFQPPAINHGMAAYLIYTSGSTGIPKGIRISHGALTNFLKSMAHTPGLDSTDKLLAVTTISFDISILELFLPLTCGAEVVVADHETASDGGRIMKMMEEHDITVMQATPVTWDLMLESGWQGKENFTSLCGGEAMPVELAGKLLSKSRKLWNLYGPTETTIWSTANEITPEEVKAGRSGGIGIGQPIDNTTIQILGANNMPLPAGAIGELCIGGRGLAQGYHKDEELTAKGFINVDNELTDGKAILYRTGDMARFRADGKLDCLGRSGRQIKLRGFRIEPGEIETHIRRYGGVKNAVVTVFRKDGGLPTLTAYLVENANEEINISDLRNSLYDSLPDYMVPAAYIKLDKLPLTPNGKIAHKQLPAPSEKDDERLHEPPQNELQEKLAAIWQDVLEVKRVGSNDHFLHLGGNSLAATRILRKIEYELEIRLPVRTIFEEPTITRLAEVLDSLSWAASKAKSEGPHDGEEIEV